MTTRRRTFVRLAGFLALVLLAAACRGDEPAAAPTPEPTGTVAPTEEPPPTPGAVFPLTGLPVEDEAALERPVLAVKIDNLAAARPQEGLEHADLVFVELVEGATRFIALYHSTDPGVVGPVRSGRYVDADILPAFTPVFAVSGAAADVLSTLRDSGLLVFVEGQADGAFFRQEGRRRPHDLMATAAALWEAAQELPPSAEAWPYAEEVPGGGTPVQGVEVVYPRSGSSGWGWDEEAQAWVRSQDDQPHVTAGDERIAAANVLVPVMPATGLSTRPIDVVGEGEATLFRNGQQFPARWRKVDKWTQFEWLTAEGEPLPLAPGRTWVELVPSTGQVTVQA
jgi:hypothetical protein